jgi:DNA-directed RNA polymerase subunit RPC12/RpoP
MHGVWPTKDIAEAVAEAGDSPDGVALRARMAAGRRTALFVYPRDKGKPPVGYRLGLYCPSCLVVDDEDCGTSSDAKGKADDPPPCGRCGGKRMSLKRAVEDGIQCPHCGKRLEPSHWFTK